MGARDFSSAVSVDFSFCRNYLNWERYRIKFDIKNEILGFLSPSSDESINQLQALLSLDGRTKVYFAFYPNTRLKTEFRDQELFSVSYSIKQIYPVRD